VIEKGKELGNIKCYNTGMALSEPPCINEVSKVYSCISSRSLSDASQLIRVHKAVGCHMKL